MYYKVSAFLLVICSYHKPTSRYTGRNPNKRAAPLSNLAEMFSLVINIRQNEAVGIILTDYPLYFVCDLSTLPLSRVILPRNST